MAKESNKNDRKGKATADQTSGNKEVPATEGKMEKVC
jgi:hypothetical protein